uniref:Radial spoke head protein 9 homolog n=1 Tax=Strigamia maritima TaxID=126957 RepID=T1J3A4_STRMM
MDSDYLVTDLDYLAVNGVTFTTEERALLHNSLTLLKQDGKFRKVYFWGKLMGLQKSYYIGFGLHRDILRQKQTFYSQDMKKWNLLTSPSLSHRKLCTLIRKPLLGDPAYEEIVKLPVYLYTPSGDIVDTELVVEGSVASDILHEEEEDEEEIDTEDETDKIKKESVEKPHINDTDSLEDLEFDDIDDNVITDEERLACIVQQIDYEAALAPRGAYVRTPIGEVLTNRFFTGLDLTEAAKPQNYLHVRFPKEGSASKIRTSSEFARTIDFLDTIADDDPKGCWSIQIDSTRDVAILRNLWWPGMVFYHRVCSIDFGFIYLGYGTKNVNLPFML